MKTSISETFQVKLKPEVLLLGVRFCSEMLNQLSCRIESFLSHTQNEVVNKRRELFKTVKKKGFLKTFYQMHCVKDNL